jgi:Uncharacterised nucleotidyltransferase
VSTLQKEWGFLCLCVSPYSQPQKIAESLTQNLQWPALLGLAVQHGVEGLLARRLQQVGFTAVPSAIHQSLQNRIRAQQISSLALMAELFRVVQNFSNARIETVLVKGPVISLLAYDNPAIRSYVDLDLLLRQRDLRNAMLYMLQMGFESDVPESVVRAGKIAGEYVFRRPGTQCTIELHTESTLRYHPKPIPIDVLFGRKRTVCVDDREIPALSLEDELLLNCIHAAKHLWERLIWVSDVAAIVANHPELDWEKLLRAAADVRATRMLHVAIQLGVLLLALDVPPRIAAQIAKDEAVASLCRSILSWLPYAGSAPPPLARRAMFRLRMAGGGLTGAAYLARLSLSPTHEDWVRGAEVRRSWWWDALHRPFRLFRKYGSSQ